MNRVGPNLLLRAWFVCASLLVAEIASAAPCISATAACTEWLTVSGGPARALVLPLFNFDDSCSAMAQGPTRPARGMAFARYVNEKYAVQQKALVVPGCGHSALCMYTADVALPLIFPKQ